MKMIILLAKENLAGRLMQTLTREQFRVTRIASTGGFLRKRVETLLLGVETSQMDAALQKIQSVVDESGETLSYFVMDVSRFERV